ncbi:MFS transporter [Cohnella xylanilytica]|uniref:MFS transporter n=1 Tax=Cohnella xylanilytica TaxID=557555 RepID=A0A841UA61_9BACL|nr:MFS transporter [Cohnella xylanilytica]MBB6694851.1 MFS transporter [Cohnella xylanilytica]
MTRSRILPYSFFGLQGLSMLGSRMTSIAVGIKLFHDTGQATPLLLLSFFNELPLFFFGNWIGMAADRWKRKSAILVGDTGQMACAALLVGCLVGDIRSLWPLYAIAAVQGLFMALQSSATSALTPLMAQDKDLDRINSLKELLFPLAGVIAPSIAGMLYETSGLSGILAADLITFLLGTGGIAILALPEMRRDESREDRSGLWAEAVQELPVPLEAEAASVSVSVFRMVEFYSQRAS